MATGILSTGIPHGMVQGWLVLYQADCRSSVGCGRRRGTHPRPGLEQVRMGGSTTGFSGFSPKFPAPNRPRKQCMEIRNRGHLLSERGSRGGICPQ
eukprot:1811943-Amphidinium_carterae.1